MALEIAHFTLQTAPEPLEQPGFGLAQVYVADAELAEAELHTPARDAAR
jgi:hypothetical protein